jgi:acetoacetate decarboxylase
MARLRWVRTPEQVKQALETGTEHLESTVRSIRCVYETDPKIAAAVIPRPLEPGARPEVCVTFSQVAIHISPQFTMEIGSAIFGVRARYDGSDGIYLLTMPMTTEQAVIGGRETYGEPKKIAAIEFAREGERVAAKVSRMGFTYLEASGRVGRALGPRAFLEHAFCFKASPSPEHGKALDADPLLVRLDWRHDQTGAWEVEDAELVLRESPVDPVADVPVRRLVRCEYEEGRTRSDGRVLRSVPGDWLLPFLHGRYDDPSQPGIEI